MYTLEDIQAVDPEIAAAITAEFDRQNSHIELIASENWVRPAVMSAMGSILTNKYAEGYPGKRYYGGCECVDVVEELARERAKKLFGCHFFYRFIYLPIIAVRHSHHLFSLPHQYTHLS